MHAQPTGHAPGNSHVYFSDYAIGEHRITCPACGRGAKDKNIFGLTIKPNGTGIGRCFRCNYVETYTPDNTQVRRPPTIKASATTGQKHTTLSDWGHALWRECRPVHGVARQYLEHRHCWVPPYGDLQCHPALRHPNGYVGPALVGLITDVLTNEPLSLHRTWITPTGKAALDAPRLLLANHEIKGGVIRITPDDEVGALLGIAEGIETALSLAWTPLHVWACIDAGHLGAFPALAGINELVIAVDQDDAGFKAAAACADRWVAAGKTVYLTKQKNNDLNDELGATNE